MVNLYLHGGVEMKPKKHSNLSSLWRKPMTKKQVDALLYKVYKMLETTNMKFTLNRKLKPYGLTTMFDGENGDGITVQVDPEKKEFMSTCVHELLHILNWQWSETKVEKLERGIMRHLTDRQLLNLLKRIVLFHSRR